MRRRVEALSDQDKKLLEEKILKDLLSRTSTLCYFFALAFTLYAFTSIDIIQKFKNDLTLWDNLWPRLIFNGLPFLLLGRWFQLSQDKKNFKATVAMVAIPIIFIGACFIHAWPIMWNGGGQLYSYVHGANIYIISMTLVITSPPPRLLFLQVLTFLLGFVLPLSIILSRWKESFIPPHVFLGDFAIVFLVTSFTAYQFYKLRLKVALSDLQTRKSASLFLGSHLTEAIYEEKKDLLSGYSQNGAILALDMRGYTNFVHSTSPEIVKAFMQRYHELVARTVGKWGGYIHKSAGDGHIISLGVMNREEDLSDIPGVETENLSANERKMKHMLYHGTRVFEEIVREFEILKTQHTVGGLLLVGAGISYGPIDVLVRGDDQFRKELDIDGEPIVRAVRLESYSKFLNQNVDPDSSFLVISPEFEKSIDPKFGTRIWYTQTQDTAVRDYPWIKFIYFRQWKHNRQRPIAKVA